MIEIDEAKKTRYQELYQKSKRRILSGNVTGLSNRVYNILKRAEDGIVLEDGTINVDLLRRKIESGDIRLYRNMGDCAVREACKYVAMNEKS